MMQYSQETPEAGPRLRLTGIKQTIVLVAGGLTALGSAVTGLAAHVAFTPMLSWMLGFSPEKAQATAMRYSALAACAGACGAYLAGAAPESFLFRGILLVIGAILGAVMTSWAAPGPDQASRLRLFQMLGVAIGLFVFAQTSRLSLWHADTFQTWNAPLHLVVIGLLVGGAARVTGLVSGSLLVPTLHYFSGFSARESVALSLITVALASVLPAWSYARRGLTEPTYGNPAAIGGLLGGLSGGFLLAHVPAAAVLCLFALVTMFLSARELSRTAGS